MFTQQVFQLLGAVLLYHLRNIVAMISEKKAEELKAGDEKFEIGLIAGLPIVKVPPDRKSWAAADVFDIFISKFLHKVPPFSVLTQIDLARGHCDTKVSTRLSMIGQKVHLTSPECSSHVQSNDQLINCNSTFQKTVSRELST